MLICDHISLSVPSPLIGANIEELGTRFPDMSEVYSRRLRTIIENSAAAESVPLQRGVYIQTTGPNYETPAEIRAYGRLGADAVGMSTAVEAIAAIRAYRTSPRAFRQIRSRTRRFRKPPTELLRCSKSW